MTRPTLQFFYADDEQDEAIELADGAYEQLLSVLLPDGQVVRWIGELPPVLAFKDSAGCVQVFPMFGVRCLEIDPHGSEGEEKVSRFHVVKNEPSP